MRSARDGVAATITPQHLLLNRNALFAGGIRPHHYCLPVLKREPDRQALLEAATGGDPRFFLGTDSAPHARHTKENACGCAGIYSAHAALELYAEAFEAAGALPTGWRASPRDSAPTSTACRATRHRVTLRRATGPCRPAIRFGSDDELVPLRAGEASCAGRWSAHERRGRHRRRAASAASCPSSIDVETGGFNSRTDALLEIAAVIVQSTRDGRVRRGATHCFHVQPFEGARLEPASLEVNGIDPFHPLRPAIAEHDALQPLFREVRKAIRAHGCRRAILVGHNAAFDLGFLNAAVERTGIKRNPFHPFSCFDTATLAGVALGQTVLATRRRWWPASTGTHRSAHSAAYDAERTADLFCQICNCHARDFLRAEEKARALGWQRTAPPRAGSPTDPSRRD